MTKKSLFSASAVALVAALASPSLAAPDTTFVEADGVRYAYRTCGAETG